jgi:hypothetical protein
MPGTKLSVEVPGDAIVLNENGEPTYLRLEAFYEAVKTSWQNFDASKINPTYQRQRAPKAPIATTASSLPGASGTYIPASVAKTKK